MKIQFKTMSKKVVLFSIMTSIALTGGAGSTFAQGSPANANPQSYEVQHVDQATKYSKHVMRAVRESLGVDSKSTQLDNTIETMPKLQVMDLYLASFGKKVKGNEIRRAVKEIFDIDLDVVSKNDYGSKLSIYPKGLMESLRASFNVAPDSTEQDARIMGLTKNAAMDRYIKEHDYSLTGAESRTLINQIFGVNLNGISTLEHMQLGILSKGQWIVKSDTDLFILESSLDDVDVSIYATPYFESLTGSRELPESMVTKLTAMGFTYYEESALLYYKDPEGGSVPDAFKGQVMGVLIGTILAEYK
ncbi:hypothetical protein ACTL32_10725 [Planococcus sp. FY231025]|uniref:hypothetical protein n=1 Tax=Planococcus sp. FY231025 TaxID=3455699 RepID=UPI003F90132D